MEKVGAEGERRTRTINEDEHGREEQEELVIYMEWKEKKIWT